MLHIYWVCQYKLFLIPEGWGGVTKPSKPSLEHHWSEEIPQRTEVQETEKRKLNVCKVYKENQKELEKCTTLIVCVSYESNLQLKQTTR